MAHSPEQVCIAATDASTAAQLRAQLPASLACVAAAPTGGEAYRARWRLLHALLPGLNFSV